MGKLIISENVSLDGVIQDPAGDEGFQRGGWVGRVGDRGREEAAQVLLEEALGTEAMLLGRRSYEFLAARWPSRTGALADRLNSKPKYVVSSTPPRSRLEQHHGPEGQRGERGLQAEAAASRGHRRPCQLPARPHADRARPRRRAAADDLPGRAQGR